ncbi:SMI1/KNR4 family protein [Aquimarina rubra]|uniref:SMI1/KNR4 family protein n=1 Tax=Aquimarina rubra TaxID=1920033 RepID=A0ABW5LLY3_9FLAO
MYLEESKNFLKDYPQITSEFRGCSEQEIDNLESILNEKIPEAFKEFLGWFGKSGGKILRGTDYYYPFLSGEAYEGWKEENIVPQDHTFKDVGIDLLNRNNFDGKKILENSILFMSHQGYAIEFLKVDEGENPPVYIFVEQDKWLKEGPTVWAKSFSEYLLNMLKQEIESWKKLGLLD